MLACVPEAIATDKRLLDAEADVTPGEVLRLELEASTAQRHGAARRDRGPPRSPTWQEKVK
jgi:hypothetical protein